MPRSKKNQLQLFQPHPAYEVAEVKVSYKTNYRASDRPMVKDSKSAYDILLGNWDPDTLELCEEFKVLYLNRASNVLALYNMSKGGISGTVAELRHAFVTALQVNASSMVLSHNHPSGSVRPSRADEDLTTKFKEAGKIMEVKVLDHIIVTRFDYFSFADNGLL